MGALDNVVRHLNLSEQRKMELLAYFSEHTKYGLINAVANLAARTKDVEEQIRLEEFGGRLLESSGAEFERIIAEGEGWGPSRRGW